MRGDDRMRFQVPVDAAGLTLGKFLYDRIKLSRNLVRRAKNDQGLLVDGRPVRVSYVLAGGERVQVQVQSEGRVQPEALPLAVVYEDAEVLVVEKPAGMVVHPVRSYVSGTLANAVAYHLAERGEEAVARPVLRIDRETSGLVLFGKTPIAAQRLAGALEQYKLERRYLAFAHGEFPADTGTAVVPIRRVWGHPVAREAAVGPRTSGQEAELTEAEAAGRAIRDEWRAAGQRAVTHWQVLQRWPGVALLALQLETGRTHQIRVHLAHAGHPLLGDELYGRSGRPGRQALHAATLAFAHPATGEVVRFESPLPPDLVQLKESLDAGDVLV